MEIKLYRRISIWTHAHKTGFPRGMEKARNRLILVSILVIWLKGLSDNYLGKQRAEPDIVLDHPINHDMTKLII